MRVLECDETSSGDMSLWVELPTGRSVVAINKGGVRWQFRTPVSGSVALLTARETLQLKKFCEQEKARRGTGNA